jgi:hypothetical protein
MDFGAVCGVIVVCVDEHVVHVYCKPSLADFINEDSIHHRLEGCRGVGKAEEHDVWFEQALIGDEGRFPLVAVFYTDVIVTPADVKFGKESGSFYTSNKFWD